MTSRNSSRATLSLLLALSPTWSACGGSSEPTVDAPAPATYHLRGVIRQVRELGDSKTQLYVRHEAIPDFVGIEGDVVGMKSMTMPFAVAKSVDLTGIEPGSKVYFELSVDWNRSEPGRITAIETLPEDTVLTFDASN